MTNEYLGSYNRGYIDITIFPRKVLVTVGEYDDDPKAKTFIGTSVYLGIDVGGFFINPGGFTKDFPIGNVDQAFHLVKDEDGVISIHSGFV